MGKVEFVASDFRGMATYAKISRPTCEGAKRAARELIAQRSNDPTSKSRPVAVYAWDGSNQVHCDLVYP